MSTDSIRRALRTKELKGELVVGRFWVIQEADLQDFIERRRQHHASS